MNGPGDVVSLEIERMAHGGEGIGLLDGRVVFVRGAFPGDSVSATIVRAKKNYARAELREILSPSSDRVEQRCAAAVAGAGCCDFGAVQPVAEMRLKKDILRGQLERVGGLQRLPVIETLDLAPHAGWRTRVRLGVDQAGRAGVRAARSAEVINVPCSQNDPALEAVCSGTYAPGAEIVAVIDSAGRRHVVETRRAPRGRRTERVSAVLEGTGTVVQDADGHRFSFPATAFWQAHRAAPGAYTAILRNWLLEEFLQEDRDPVAWDLYGGVGLFVPALADSLGDGATVHSVDTSAVAPDSQETLGRYQVRFHKGDVAKKIGSLPRPQVVLLDPPRSGAGEHVVKSIVDAGPEVVVHVGCDPATFARDVAAWGKGGLAVKKLMLINAFPGTHHFEVMALLRPE